MITPSRLVTLALVTQAGLAAAAVAGAAITGLRFAWGDPLRDVAIGGLAAVVLAAVNFGLLHRPAGVWRRVRAAVDDVLIPTFSTLAPWQVAVVSIAAGVGEELFFRGFLQPLVGLVGASVAFGLAHVAGARMAAFGVWAAAMGAALGGLALVTGGLLAPMTAHACYDVLAFSYLGAEGRRQASQGSGCGEG